MTLIVACISFFVNRHLTSRDKKFELKFKLFQSEKIVSINRFIAAYIKAEHVFTQLDYRSAIKSSMSVKELDDKIIPVFNEFTSSYYSLFLVLEDPQLEEFSVIYNSVCKIKSILNEKRFLYDSVDDNSFHLIEDYVSTFVTMSRSNEKLLKNIGKSFKSDMLK